MSAELPAGWAEVPLGALLEPGGLFDGPFGSNLKTGDYTPSGVRVIRLENVANLRFIDDKETYISDAKYRSLVKHTVAEGDIIVGSFVDGAVRVCVLPRLPTKAIAKADCFTVRTDLRLADRNFLTYQLGANETRDALVEDIHGATRPRITTKQLRELRVRLPPFSEQRRIVAKVEELMAEVNRAAARLSKVQAILKRFRQSVLAAACSGELTREWREGRSVSVAADDLDDAEPPYNLPAGWRWIRLGKLARFINGDRSKNYPSKKHRVANGIPFINAGHLNAGHVDFADMDYITDERFDMLSSGKVAHNDILYCLRGSLGKAAVVRGLGRGAIASSLLIIRVDASAASIEYLFSYLTSPLGQEMIAQYDNGSAQPNLSAADVARYLVPLPPPQEQTEIARCIDHLFVLANAIEQRVRVAERRVGTLPQSVLAKAFSGELVPTESEVAQLEGRDYEPAPALVARIKAEGNETSERKNKGLGKRRTAST